jgi:hypothetical protein
VKVTGIDGLYDPKIKDQLQYIAHARGLLGPLAKGATLKFLQCFKQVREKQTYWQCGVLILVWAWCIGQGWSTSKILDFDVDQGSKLHDWVVDLIGKDGPVPEPPAKVRKKPNRVKVDEEAWSLSPPPSPPSPTSTSKKRQRETPEQEQGKRKTPDRVAKRAKNQETK